MQPSFAVLLRAVAPTTWSRCRRVLAAVREIAPVPVTLLVVPRLHGQPHCERFDEALSERLAMGDELALHGYMHEDDGPRRGVLDRLEHAAAGFAEFGSLRCDDALQRLHGGLRWFAANGWPVNGFVAPDWRLGPGAWAALRLTPFAYTLTRDALHSLYRDEDLPSYSIEHRTGNAWARAASLAWNALPGRLGQDAAPLVRLELTPDAADHRDVKRAWQCCLHRHLMYRHAQTAAQVLQTWERPEPLVPAVRVPARVEAMARFGGAAAR